MSAKIGFERPESASRLWVLGDEIRFMGAVEEKNVHVLDVTVPPGSGTPPHRHASPEFFRVSEGEVNFEFFYDGTVRTVVAGPGSVVTLPGHIGHSYANRGNSPAVMTAIVEAQMVEFFKEIGTLAPPAGVPSSEVIGRVMAACERYGIEILAD